MSVDERRKPSVEDRERAIFTFVRGRGDDGASVREIFEQVSAKLDDTVAMYLADVCTLPVNLAGLLGIAVPCGLADDLPVGLQLIGPAWSEATLLRAARGYEGVTAGAPWRAVRPHALDVLRDPTTPPPPERMAAAAAVRS